jgi:hypothetical protein
VAVTVRIVIWSVVAILVIAGAVYLLSAKSGPDKLKGELTRDQLFEYAGRLQERIDKLEGKFGGLEFPQSAGSQLDSLTLSFKDKLAVCRQLVDSLRLFTDIAAGRLAYERLDAAYQQAKALLARIERLATPRTGLRRGLETPDEVGIVARHFALVRRTA